MVTLWLHLNEKPGSEICNMWPNCHSGHTGWLEHLLPMGSSQQTAPACFWQTDGAHYSKRTVPFLLLLMKNESLSKQLPSCSEAQQNCSVWGKQKQRIDLWLTSSFANIDRRFHIVMLLSKVQDHKFQEADVALWIFRKLIILRNGNIFKPSGSAHLLVSMCTDACICFFQRQKCSYCVLK